MRMKHHGLGPPDRPDTRLFDCAIPVSPVAVRESSALEVPTDSPLPVNHRGKID
jgi:hypothetical protein